MSVTNPVIDYIDGPARRIHLLAGITVFHPIDDIYKEVRYLRRTVENLQKFEMFCEAGGNIQRVGNSYTPRYLRLLKGTKIVAGAGVDRIQVTGDIFTDDSSDPDIFDNSLLESNRRIFYTLSAPEAEIIIVNSEGDSVGSGLTPQQSTQLTQIHARTGRVDALIENVSGDRFTAKSLEQAPVGTGEGGSGATPQQIWEYTNRSLTDKTNFNLSATAITAIVSAVWSAATRTLTAIDKTGYSLTSTERSAIATSVEAALINDGDGQQLINAILQVINSNLDIPPLELTAIAQAVRSALSDDFANVAIDLSPVTNAINNLPTLAEIQGILPNSPDNLSIGLILDKVNDIQINPQGRVLAEIDQVIDVNPATIANEIETRLDPRFDGLNTAIGSLPSLSSIQSILPPDPDNSGIAAIRLTTDAITVTNGKVEAAVDGFSVSLDPQDVRDAMALSLSGGVTVETGSIDARLQLSSDQATIAAINTQGGWGGSGGSEASTVIYGNALDASQALSALRVVRVNAQGYLDYANAEEVEHAFTVIGILTTSVALGATIAPITRGVLSDSSWSWITGIPIFLGVNGMLTQSPPQSGFLLQVATPISSTQVLFEIQDPIIL